MKKKIDNRIRVLIENGVKMRHRSLFVIVGDKAKDQVVNLHYVLTKASVKPQPDVLWCYKKELGFSSHAKKRMKAIKRDIQRGMRDTETEDPFELFISSTKIRYTYYKETHTILGNTFGMCILQDFEALTPNLLARTIETVEGGGIIVLLIKTMDSLKQLYTMSMDVHDRFRTESHQDVVARFNERFILSLASCQQCLVVDDELNILPISSHVRSMQAVTIPAMISADGDETHSDVFISAAEQELVKLKLEMQHTLPVGALLQACRSLDQAKAVLTFVDAIADKTLRSTCAMTAGRGRGKSAALGLSLAGAIAYGYANIYVTAPSPENLHTLFQMVLAGFDALEYKEHADYEVVQATAVELNQAVVRINVFRAHRQTIQYIAPQDYARLSQAELVVIDEAAAIPLPLVKKLLGPYLVFISSTVNGYEGTGRSLSLKLIKELRQTSVSNQSASSSATNTTTGGRMLREIDLKEPIRYGVDDGVEKWLTDLLCLDCVGDQHRIIHGTPHPNQCELYHVNRDTLFSYHRASEAFLQRMMSLYVSSHYKNAPNDLQLMSDAPAHHLFVLLGPVQNADDGASGDTKTKGGKDAAAMAALPDILCVIQVCLEGEISKASVMSSMSRGDRAAGDLIPWTISQQFQDNEFPQLSGARIVRIATHPDLNRMGYATRALQLLSAYYEGKITNLDENTAGEDDAEAEALTTSATVSSSESPSLLAESIKPRKKLRPLMQKLSDRRPETLQWIGTSFGLTQGLFNFWKKSGYASVYVRQTANDLTGEHTCIMLKTLGSADTSSTTGSDMTLVPPVWLTLFCDDFRRRFLSLLSFSFAEFESIMALSVLDPYAPLIATNPHAYDKESAVNPKEIVFSDLHQSLSEWDLKRLESYARNLVDYHMILDLVPVVARFFFLGRFTMSLSYTQSALLMALGLQHKSVSQVEKEMDLASNQVLALFNRAIRKISIFIRSLEERSVANEMSEASAAALQKAAVAAGGSAATPKPAKPLPSRPLKTSLATELKQLEAEDKTTQETKQKTQEFLTRMNLEDFAVTGTDEQWSSALGGGSLPSTISIKNAAKSANPDYVNKKKREADLALLKAQLDTKKEASLSAKKPKHSHGTSGSTCKFKAPPK